MRSGTAVLAFIIVGATGIASAQTAPTPALVQELNVVNVSRVQEKGEVQVTLSLRSRGEEATEGKSVAGQLGLELGLTDRLQISLDAPVIDQSALTIHAKAIEIGIAYELLRRQAANLIIDINCRPGASRNGEIRITSAVQLGRGEIHSGVGMEMVRDERNVQLDLAGVWPWRDWRGTLEMRHQSGGAQTLSITPGVAWIRHGVQLGIGIGVPSHQSKALAMLSSTIEF